MLYAGRDYCHSRRDGYGWLQHLTSQILCPLTFHIHPFCISHIPYPKDLDQNIPNPTLFVLNHRIFVRREGEKFFVLIIYIFQEHRNICKSPGRGIIIMLPVTRPETISIRRHPSGGNNSITSNTALAETRTNLIDVSIVARDGNAFSVLRKAQNNPLSVPLSIDQAQSSRSISQGIQLQQYPRD